MKLFVAVVLLFCAMSAFGQAPLPNAPIPQNTVHKFWDAPNLLSTAVLAGTLSYDGYAHCYDHQLSSATPSYIPFVRNCQDFLLTSALAFGGSLGLTGIFHSTGHHKLERVVNWATVGAAGYGIYYLKREK